MGKHPQLSETGKGKITLVILGRSGSGKGTQAKFILQRLGKTGHHLETGRFIRGLIATYSNPTITRLDKVLKAGKLSPPWVAAFSWFRELIQGGKAAHHLVFDGTPRTCWEAECLDAVMEWHGRALPLCIYIDVSEQEAAKRLLVRGRGDDRKVAIRNRMKFFTKDVIPVTQYYRKQNRLLHINGNQSTEEVWSQIDKTLTKRFAKKWPTR
ncbi:MAG: nucleoside monophosphate kinase [Nitrospinae bacterium]|nr:nucleoside monophosphate kinase [Nitrospinota bacterium]